MLADLMKFKSGNIWEGNMLTTHTMEGVISAAAFILAEEKTAKKETAAEGKEKKVDGSNTVFSCNVIF